MSMWFDRFAGVLLVAALSGGFAGAAEKDPARIVLEDPVQFEALLQKGEAALPELVAGLKGPRPDLAVQGMGRLKLPSAVPALLPLAADPDGELRAAVAWALGECRDPQSVAALIRLARDPYAPTRAAAMLALAELRRPEADTVLKAGCADPDGSVRLAAINAVRLAGRKDLAMCLTGLLAYEALPENAAKPAANDPLAAFSETVVWKEPNPQMRLAVVRAFAELKNPETVPTLILVLERETDFNRREVIRGLLGMGPSVAPVCLGRITTTPYEKDAFERYLPLLINNSTLAVIAGRLGDERCVPYLRETLKLPRQHLGADPVLTDLYIQTIDLLGRYRVERAAGPLVDLLKENSVKEVADAIEAALRQIGRRASQPLATRLDSYQLAPLFFRLLRDPELRSRAARDTIVKYLTEESDEVRLEATETLGLYLYEGLLDEYDMPLLEVMELDSNSGIGQSATQWRFKIGQKRGNSDGF